MNLPRTKFDESTLRKADCVVGQTEECLANFAAVAGHPQRLHIVRIHAEIQAPRFRQWPEEQGNLGQQVYGSERPILDLNRFILRRVQEVYQLNHAPVDLSQYPDLLLLLVIQMTLAQGFENSGNCGGPGSDSVADGSR